MVMCHVCGVDVERTVDVMFDGSPIPEKWCLICLRKPEYGGEDATDNTDIGWYPED